MSANEVNTVKEITPATQLTIFSSFRFEAKVNGAPYIVGAYCTTKKRVFFTHLVSMLNRNKKAVLG
jgi:hypothetical protein